MDEMKKYFSKKDIAEVELIARIALEGIDTSQLNKEESKNLVELLELTALEDLYRRRYKNS